MQPIRVIAATGVVIAAVGSFVCLKAGALATEWTRTESGNGWGGRMDPVLQYTYQDVGRLVLAFGLVLLVAAAWNWMARERGPLNRPTAHL
jgi:hypothetical protein